MTASALVETWSAIPTERASIAAPHDRLDALALSFVYGVGPTRYRAWALADGGADRAFARRLSAPLRDRARERAGAALARADRAGATLCLLGDAEYPSSLLDLSDAPSALWCLGDRPLLGRAPAAAIVGTRDATAYGERVAAQLARATARAGVAVVSGMARGVDAAAHVAALEVGGATVAVLGTGVDVPYPATHRGLYRRIVERGLVISEAEPGTRATPGAFPRRNRVVAALASATVVVEAGVKSGALITASLALDLGRDVAAVPGAVDVATSAGANALIRDGAAVITDANDLLELLGVPRAVDDESAPTLDGDEALVWRSLANLANSLDALDERVRLGARRCVAAVGALEAMGLVQVAFDGAIARR